MDIGTGLAVFGSAKIVERLFGPTADYIGEGMKDWTARRCDNLRRIVATALRRLGQGIDKPGAIPPKALQLLLTEGSYFETDLGVEYYDGVLASSRTPSGFDDRGAAFMQLLARLTNYQLRAHYIFYWVTRQLFLGSDKHLAGMDRPAMEAFIDHATFRPAMGFRVAEMEEAESLYQHIMFGLAREDLIGEFEYGQRGLMVAKDPRQEGGIRFVPSVLGAQLFLWAHGHPRIPADEILSVDREFKLLEGVDLGEKGWSAVND